MNFSGPPDSFDEHAVVTITRVGPKAASGNYYITDSLGRKFSTKNSLVASLAQQYLTKQIPCRPISYDGFFARDLIGLDRVAPTHGAAS